MPIILIVGLGNPGYSYSPHNIGADVLKAAFNLQKNFNVLLENQNIILYMVVCPAPMNISGPRIKKLYEKYNCTHLVILVDELDLPLQTIKISENTMARGHNGIRSIIAAFGHNNFIKMRIGIGRPEDSVAQFVLAPWPQHTIELILQQTPRYRATIEDLIKGIILKVI